MISASPTRTSLRSAGLIASLTALAICAVVCSWTVAQEGPAQRPHAIAWESSVVRSTGEKTDEPASPTIEWTSDPAPNVAISPEAFKAARWASQKATAPPALANPATTIGASRKRQVSNSKNAKGRAKRISARDLAAETAVELIDPSSFDPAASRKLSFTSCKSNGHFKGEPNRYATGR